MRSGLDVEAEAAYSAYGAATGGLTYDGKAMPEWADLPQKTKDAWAAAAFAIRGVE